MANIHFFNEDLDFSLANQPIITQWLQQLIVQERFDLVELNYIFCSDPYLHQMNVDYLGHDTYTDIITFDNSESSHTIEADIFISIDRVKENAPSYHTSFEKELHRVMAHGLLHLFGFPDKTEEQKEEMRKREEACLSLLSI